MGGIKMRIFYFLAAVLVSAAIVILLGLTPDRISADIMSLMHRDRSLKYKAEAISSSLISLVVPTFSN